MGHFKLSTSIPSHRRIYASTILLVAITVSLAHSQEPATKTDTSYKPADVQTEASRVYIFVDKTGLGHQHGVEAKLLASTLALGSDHDAGQLVFDMTSFNADTPAARKYVGLTGTTDEDTRTTVNNNMRGTAILNIAKFPTATFDVVSAKATGEASSSGLPVYRLEGDFTLHGTKQPIIVMAEVEQSRGWLHVSGNFIIKQTAYGITPYSKAFGAIGVTDQLKIFGDLYVAPTEDITMSNIPSRK